MFDAGKHITSRKKCIQILLHIKRLLTLLAQNIRKFKISHELVICAARLEIFYCHTFIAFFLIIIIILLRSKNCIY